MERIPFDIKLRPEIEAGKFLIETRDGSPVRIVCWDAKAERPILYLVFVRGKEWVYSYPLGGFYHSPEVVESDNDLFLVPNPDHKEPTTICSTSVDWDAFRREAAKNILCAIIPLDWVAANDTKEKMCGLSIVIADELIKQLKEGKK